MEGKWIHIPSGDRLGLATHVLLAMVAEYARNLHYSWASYVGLSRALFVA